MTLAMALAMSALGPWPVVAAVPTSHSKDMADGLELFKTSVSVLLREHCVECHGAGKIKSDFDLATREGLLKGGAEGIAVIPGKATESRLVKLISHADEPHMPSKKPRLPGDEIAQITKWIDLGAPYAGPLVEGAKVARDRSAVTEQDRAFWSFQPLIKPPVPVVDASGWARTPVDRFILAKLEEKQIKPNAAAERRVLIRRAYFDLIGLPPTADEVDAFVNDPDPQAFTKLVDRLLASPHHGERWARHWLDLARFGESHGYEQDYDRPFAHHYRDFVIRALNADLPYDKFVQWQIAGDELEPDNAEAWFATGFLGAGTHATQITANQAEKERYDELDDIINTIGTSMLGLTVGCARCHDHKFDPIPARDYYSMLATFTTTVRSDHDVDLNPAQTRTALAAWEREHAPLLKAREQFEREKLPARLDAWLKTNPALPQPGWLVASPEGFRVRGGYFGLNKSAAQDDGSQLVSITAGSPDTMQFKLRTGLTNITALRIEALPHGTLPNGGPGWRSDGGFHVSEAQVTAKPLKGDAAPAPVAFASRRGPDGAPAKTPLPWIGKGASLQSAVFEFAQPLGFDDGVELNIVLKCPNDFDRNMLGRVRASLATRADVAADGTTVAAKDFELASQVFAQDAAQWKAAEREAVMRVYRATDAGWLRLNADVEQHAASRPRPQLVKAMVCSEGLPAIRLHTQGPDFYEQTFQLKRGDLAQKQEPAERGFLQVLMRAPEAPAHWMAKPGTPDVRTSQHRAAFARWITDVEHGAGHLLARVIVNRLWQHHFGRGIVATPSDFGATGAAPTHPELLDWLAGELIRNGWQLKPVHRLLMNSAVYQQGTATDAKRLAADVDNSLCWHRKPMRLEAEIIRDAMLAVGGSLDRTMFGPGSLDEAMTRRSIYFTIKRSKLIPMLVQFDWPDSLQGIGQRVNTTVAPQALLIMNNPQVRAAAEKWAKTIQEGVAGTDLAVVKAYREALGRKPTAAELKNGTEFIASQTTSYREAEHADPLGAALTDFCQTAFALNEFIYAE